MPGFLVAADDEPCNFISADQQPSALDAYVQLSPEEKLVAEQSLSVFCKPVEFYNHFHYHTRSSSPPFLQRNFEYKILAKKNKRIQMTIMLSWSDEETQNMFPFYVSVAKRDPNNEDADPTKNKKSSTVYLLSQIITIRGSSGIDGNNKITAELTLSEVNNLAAEACSGSLFLLFFTTEENLDSSSRVKASLRLSDPTSHESLAEKNCLYGKISFQSIYLAWDSSPNFRWGQRAEIKTTVDLLPCVLKYDFGNKGTTIAIQDLWNSEILSTPKSVQIKILAKEFGAMKKSRSHRNALPSSSRSSLSHVTRLKEGNVTFNYRYYNNKLQRTEVSEDFRCPFCLVKWASYKGLRCHLLASHDFFKFEFSASKDCFAVNVSLNYDIWKFERVGDGIDPKLDTFFLYGNRSGQRSGKRITQIKQNACFEVVQGVDSPALANNADPPALANNADPPVLANDADQPVLAMDEDPPVLAIDADPPVLAMDADPPVLAMDADLAIYVEPSVLAMEADPPVLAIDVEPPVLAMDADPPVLTVDADPPILAMREDSPVLVVDADPQALAVDANPPVLAVGANPPVLAVDANPPVLAVGDANASIVPIPDPDCVPLISKHDHGTPAVLQIGNTGKLPVEHFDPQSIARLMKRQFYHSHKAQAMSVEEVLSNSDSEDDIDDETADIEDRRKLDLHPLSEEEKQFMFMWNSFIRKQRVRIDSHIRWACKAFSVLHGSEIVKSRELTWYWTMLRLKLYNLGLIDGKIINDCSNILEQHEKHNSNPEIPVANINSIHLSPLKNKRRR